PRPVSGGIGLDGDRGVAAVEDVAVVGGQQHGAARVPRLPEQSVEAGDAARVPVGPAVGAALVQAVVDRVEDDADDGAPVGDGGLDVVADAVPDVGLVEEDGCAGAPEVAEAVLLVGLLPGLQLTAEQGGAGERGDGGDGGECAFASLPVPARLRPSAAPDDLGGDRAGDRGGHPVHDD